MDEQTNLHGTCLAVGTRGVLLLGPSGSGKSDLALRLIDTPGQGIGGDLAETTLVADDQVLIRRNGTALLASAPPALHGKLEVRGVGIVPCPAAEEVELAFAVKLVSAHQIERMPKLGDEDVEILGLLLPALKLAPFHASAPAVVRTAAGAYPELFSNEN